MNILLSHLTSGLFRVRYNADLFSHLHNPRPPETNIASYLVQAVRHSGGDYCNDRVLFSANHHLCLSTLN